MHRIGNWLAERRVLVASQTGVDSYDYQRWLRDAGAETLVLSYSAVQELCRAASPPELDIAVIDVAAESEESSFYCASILTAASPSCGFVFAIGTPSTPIIERVRQLGGSMVRKPVTPPELVFSAVSAGETRVPCFRTVVAWATRRWLLSPQLARLVYYNLWSCTNQEIATALGVSLHTVQDYQRDLRRKTGARSKDGFLRRLLECSGMEPPEPSMERQHRPAALRAQVAEIKRGPAQAAGFDSGL